MSYPSESNPPQQETIGDMFGGAPSSSCNLSLDWVKGKSKPETMVFPRFSYEIWGFPANFPLNQSNESYHHQKHLDLDLHLHPSQRTGTTWHDFFLRRWCFHGVKYQITLVNWLNYSQSVTKAARGWLGWLTGDWAGDDKKELMADGSCIQCISMYSCDVKYTIMN